MEEQTIAIVSFNGALKREIMKVRNSLQKVDTISEFRVDIEIKGRVSQGDIEIVFKLSNGVYGDTSVEGCDLAAVTEEFLRRKGWKERNKPLLLTVAEQNRADADKPFDKGSDNGSNNDKGQPESDF